MAGHSHWAKIKRAKGANDAKRGKIWSKIARKIIIAAPTASIRSAFSPMPGAPGGKGSRFPSTG